MGFSPLVGIHHCDLSSLVVNAIAAATQSNLQKIFGTKIFMDVQIIQVPYYCGHKDLKQGRGPSRFMDGGLGLILEEQGHAVHLESIEIGETFRTEMQSAININRLLAGRVADAIRHDRLPLVLAGNCYYCLGSLAGIRSHRKGIVWFDVHGDFNTPETTTSGYLDGMPLAMATGRCWSTLLETMPGFATVRGANTVLVGALALDDLEKKALHQSDLVVIATNAGQKSGYLERLEAALIELKAKVDGVYVHLDMDALDTGKSSANPLDPPGGLKVDQFETALCLINTHLRVWACNIASYNPEYDQDGSILESGLRLAQAIVGR